MARKSTPGQQRSGPPPAGCHVPPLTRVLAALAALGHTVASATSGYTCRCPAHDDSRASLSVGEGDDGKALLWCHAGCTYDEVVQALGLKKADLFSPSSSTSTSKRAAGPKPRPVAKPAGKAFATAKAAVAELERRHGKRAGLWTYADADGKPVMVVVRFSFQDGSKEFRPVHRAGDGWRIGALPKPRPLYMLPDLAAAEVVLWVEGEKAADAARQLGYVVTTHAGGSQATGQTDYSPLAGKRVVLLPDNDDAGRGCVERVGDILMKMELPPRVKVVELPGLPPKGDIVDWIAARPGKDLPELRAELEAIIAAAPYLTLKSPSNIRDSRDKNPVVDLWQPPCPLPDMPPVEKFPLGVFPPAVREYWAVAAESLAVPVDYVAVPGMVLLGAAIGRSRVVQIKNGYQETAAMWAVEIAPPGSVKSPSLKAARSPLAEVERGWRKEYASKREAYEAAVVRHEEATKGWRRGGCVGPPPAKPPRPAPRQLTLDDTTTEAAALVLRDNPRGVVIVKDELDGWVLGMNQYRHGGKGSDKQFWLSAWAGQEAKYNRKGTHDEGPLVVSDPFVGVCGMMTPASLANIRTVGRDGEPVEDGFSDRFLWSYPDPVAAVGESWTEVREDQQKRYAEVFRGLLALKGRTEGDETEGMTPAVMELGAKAREMWEHFTREVATQMNALDRYDHYRGVLSKLRGYCGRFVALLWPLRQVCNEVSGTQVDEETVIRATTLVNYFDTHARRCLGVNWADRKSRVAKRVLGWLVRYPDRTEVSRSEVFIAVKDRRDVTTSEAITAPLKILVDHGYLRPMDPSGGCPGPAPELYQVNPRGVRSPQSRP